ncbi:MAG: hypothetical protein FJW20_06785 [Acidimicrobiia bacterium]|nr:hypothetical protein [Acidimicrobiia bacterium]
MPKRDDKYRGGASLYLPGKPLGPFKYYGTRRDDPNDVTPHEHRRDLRGLSVFCAWLGSKRSSEDWIADSLIKRRDKIGRGFFSRVLPLDGFAVQDGKLVFVDLEVKHGFRRSRNYQVEWAVFDNHTEKSSPLAGAAGFAIPAAEGGNLSAKITAEDGAKSVTVYLMGARASWKVVGIERTW